MFKHRAERKAGDSPEQSKNEKLCVRKLKVSFSQIKLILGPLTQQF